MLLAAFVAKFAWWLAAFVAVAVIGGRRGWLVHRDDRALYFTGVSQTA